MGGREGGCDRASGLTRVLTVCEKASRERPARPGNARRGRLWARPPLLLHFQALASLQDEDRKRGKKLLWINSAPVDVPWRARAQNRVRALHYSDWCVLHPSERR